MSAAPGGNRPSVVLADDSPEVRRVVQRLLESAGFDVVGQASDGDEAIIEAYRRKPALLLLDTSMPNVDGMEALPAILALSPETRVVMFTGFEEPGLADRARELGAVDLVEKSLSLMDLPERLFAALDTPDPHAETVRETRSDTTYAEAGEAVATFDTAKPEEQALLREHVAQFRELFDRAEIGMATLTSSGTIVRANRALAALMSCSPFDLVGVDYGRLTSGQGDELDRKLDDICSLGEDLTSFEHHLPGTAGDDSRVVRVTLAPIRDSKGQVLYVFAQVHDVTAQRAIETELRRSEENFRRLVTAVTEYAIFMLAPDGTVVSWNSGAQRIKGYTAGEIVGRHFRAFYTPEDQADRHPESNLKLALLEGGYAEEGWRVRKDGTRFWAMVVITPVYDDAGRHVGFAKVTRDRSEQRAHEEERRQLLDQRIHLLAVTAHELKNPTAVIDGSVALVRSAWEAMSPGEQEEVLRGMRSSTDRLRRLAADLATAAESAGDVIPMTPSEVSLTDTLRSAAARLQAAGVDARVEVDVPEEAVFDADAQRLGQALDNLLNNAVRHGQPPFVLSGRVDDRVHMRVTDAGTGVPAELAPRLFERFAVGSATGGTGLGLYLVREIARLHGGDVTYHPPTASSAAAFELTVPRRPWRV